jgi:alpha-D-ribose 1-methylphosphonate 5-triphosphate diphosphatase
MHVVMGAPNVLRGGSHSGNLSAVDAIAAGVVDMLAADYAPAAMVQAVFELARKGILPLYQAARLAGQGPAAAMGLKDRGTLEIGKRADIALIEAGPRPRVRATLRQGRPIFWDGNMADRG